MVNLDCKKRIMSVPQLDDFEFLIDTSLENFLIACKPLDETLIIMAYQVKDAFLATKALIIFGLTNPEPEKDHPLMLNYRETIRIIVESKAAPKDTQFTNHLATVREVVLALGFMTVKPAPTQYIRDMLDASQYYANRVLSKNKGVEKHMLFVTKVNELFSDLLMYVKKHHLTGFSWNTCKSPIGKSSAAFPPPPPPPPPAEFCDPNQSGDGARIALLNQLNQGSDITRHLRPVHRGGAASEPIRQSNAHLATSAASGKPVPKTYKPKLLLDGKKWLIEHQQNNFGIVINNENMSESVACYKVENSNLTVANKVNNVVIDSCRRTSVSLKSVIASVELIRCDRVQIKCDGLIPLINLDNCESIQIFLSSQSRDVEIVSAKCSSCNVCLLENDGSYKELPMQEQIKTVLSGNKLNSTVIEKN